MEWTLGCLVIARCTAVMGIKAQIVSILTTLQLTILLEP